MNDKVLKSFIALKKFVEQEDYKGWDPFDGLNSKLFQKIPLLKRNKWARLAWLQFFKRSPLNFRRMVLVPKEENPKGLALFLLGYINLYQSNPSDKIKKNIKQLSERLIRLQSKGYSGAAWGYNFDWQARAFFQPKFTPTSVATSFSVEALLKASEILNDKKLLKTALSSKDFILHDLNRTYDHDGDFIFSYSPLDQTQVFNAGLLSAKTLILLFEKTGEKKLKETAEKVFSYVAKRQNPDGSWVYGTLSHHQWIDSFHTGYNLEAFLLYQKITADEQFNPVIQKGMNYYLTNFFTSEGVPKYFHNRIYPVDLHATAQLIVTLKKAELFDRYKALVEKVVNWSVENMQSEQGYFYYQKLPLYTNKIPYMRWTQAWMFYALTFLINKKLD